MDRGEVKIREGKVTALIDLYKDTYQTLSKEIISATTAGRVRKAQTMARIRAALSDMGVDVGQWIEQELPQYYKDGANQAIQDLRDLGIDVDKGLTVLDRRAISALVSEVGLAFADSITVIGRSARNVLTQAQKQQIQATIAQGKLTGDTVRAIVNEVKLLLQNEGITALVDKAGRSWTFDRYAEMLVRTKAVEARNQGLANRMLEAGLDLVQVSNHNSEHEECRVWEGKILSISGRTPKGTKLGGGYIVAGTLSEAINAGLFHPNCQHAINVINPDLARRTKAYENPYNRR